MTTITASISPRSPATKILEPMLDSGEELVWSETPAFGKILTAGLRQAVLHPLHLMGIVSLASAAALSFAFRDAPPLDPTMGLLLAAVVLGLAGPFLIDLVIIPVQMTYSTPLAYGSTRSYLLYCAGPLNRRLIRTPLSLVTDLRLVRSDGTDAIVFEMISGHKAEFSFLHLAAPAETLARLKSTTILTANRSNQEQPK